MIVDDDIVSRKVLSRIMKDVGLCHEFDSGDVALFAFESAIMQKQPYGLVMLDINMPDMDGFEVMNRIHDIEKMKRVQPEKRAKIVMVTERSDRSVVMQAVEAHCDDYVVKPYSKSILNRLRRGGVID